MRLCFFIILALFSSVTIISCQKEIDPYTPQTGTDSTDVPVDTTTTIDTSTAGAYQPLTTGTFWKYKDSASGTETTNSIGDSTKTINGIYYRQYLSTSGTTTTAGWIAAPSPNYYLTVQGTSPNTNAPFDLTFYYLNDTASVGYSKDLTAGSGNGFTAYTTTKIVAKGLTMTVEGKTYKDVIQTHLDLSYDIFGTVTNYGGYDYFTAKGIGFIKIRAFIGIGGAIVTQTCSNLVDYSIK